MMQRNNIEIIPFSPEMAEDIAEIEKECFTCPWSCNAIIESFKFNTAYFVARYHEKLIGYIGVQNIAGEGYVTNVAVTAEFRGNGIGAMLVKRALRYCTESELSFLSLEVRCSNTPAISLYSKLGFNKVGERKKFYHDPTEDAIIMTNYLKWEETA